MVTVEIPTLALDRVALLGGREMARAALVIARSRFFVFSVAKGDPVLERASLAAAMREAVSVKG